ncbi:helix-turn-helix domain-containing protein [Nonomuraea sp. NPDC049129]|uniref:TetR/AcrR family transcriptional regulator n=1 Tax=unclassified Nonomuraea TaxID=2593643 RepID=UPI0033C5D3E1
MARVGRPPQDPKRQLERAHRILDAAAELCLRWGYDKTTIDDVARQAEVAKGTIYLHWKTREMLFAALIRRERVLLVREVRERAPADLRELLRELVGGLLRRPLMRALILDDSEVFGKLSRQKKSSQTTLDLGAAFGTYLQDLAGRDVLRSDLTPAEHLATLASVIYGFLLTQNMMPEQMRMPEDRLVELVADTGVRAMGTGATLSDDDARAVRLATLGYLDTMEEIAERKLALSLGAKERVT